MVLMFCLQLEFAVQMTCQKCVDAVTKALTHVPGKSSATYLFRICFFLFDHDLYNQEINRNQTNRKLLSVCLISVVLFQLRESCLGSIMHDICIVSFDLYSAFHFAHQSGACSTRHPKKRSRLKTI